METGYSNLSVLSDRFRSLASFQANAGGLRCRTLLPQEKDFSFVRCAVDYCGGFLQNERVQIPQINGFGYPIWNR